MLPVSITIVVTMTLLGGCATEAQRRAAENAAIEKQATQEMRRICALPRAEREAELERITSKSGIVVECGKE